MNIYRINFIKDCVPDYRSRRCLNRRLHIYVLFSGCVLVYSVFAATERYLFSHEVFKETVRVRSDYSQNYSEIGEMSTALETISESVTKSTECLLEVQEAMSTRMLLAPVLAGIILSVEDGMSLTSFELTESGRFEFSIECRGEDVLQIDPKKLIAAWKADLTVASLIKDIKPALLQRQLLGSRKAVLLRFEGSIRQGGG